MRSVAMAGLFLLLTVYASAETYTWTDENGTFNFTDDLSNVPARYRSRVQRESGPDAPAGMKLPDRKQDRGTAANVPGKSPDSEGTGSSGQGDKQQPDGTAQEEWRKELNRRRDELNGLKQQLDARKAALNGVVEERVRLSNEFNALGAEFNQKFSAYNELLESGRKAGFAAESK